MATIIKHSVNGKEYNYLSYSYRENDRVLKKEKYLGREIPPYDDLVQIWEIFSYEIFEEKWMPLIEKITKKYRKIINVMPLEIRIKNLRNFGIRFTHHSTKIEGSPLSLRDVEAVIANGILPKNKPINDAIETKAHMALYEKIIATTEELSIDFLCKWHKELFQITQHNSAGVIRDYPVEISGSNYEPPMSKIEIDMMLDDLFKWYNEKKNKLHPVFVASVVHYRFVAIHPFGDGNGRMARLLTTYILNKDKYPLFDIDPKIRYQYYKALEKADQKDYPFPFIQWFSKAYIKDNKRYL
ncbi:hypothetical protein ES705_12691 [subsurface metagenome]